LPAHELHPGHDRALLLWTVEVEQVHHDPDRAQRILAHRSGGQLRTQPGHPVSDDVTEQNVLFGREVPEEGPDRDISRLRDVLDGGLFIAPLGKQAQCGLLERLSRLQLLAFAPRGGMVDSHSTLMVT
jgi:hypothetical protein